ncbi:hypothetical protein E5D57_010558 [Metarhizium anisopliae]|nr:hypothetical protein E5D57_010558 [Metarhizium anisopliae]
MQPDYGAFSLANIFDAKLSTNATAAPSPQEEWPSFVCYTEMRSLFAFEAEATNTAKTKKQKHYPSSALERVFVAVVRKPTYHNYAGAVL